MSALSDTETTPVTHAFGKRGGLPVGIEHELLLVDPATGRLIPKAAGVISAASPTVGQLKSEIFAAQLELVTPVCRSVGEAYPMLSSMLESVRATGAAVIGSGLHPTASSDEAQLHRSSRYRQVSRALGGILRTPPSALHVHVGMPDPDTAIAVANGMRRHLPLLHSLAVNSPFWYGRDSGLASARTAILRSYPRYGVPPRFRDWEHFLSSSQELATAAEVPDYTYFWWDVRPHPGLGTVEVRAPDAQFSLRRTVSLAALIHSLVRREIDAPAHVEQERDAIEAACFQATRYGLQARLPDEQGEMKPARALAREMIAKVAPYAQELGCAEEVRDLCEIIRNGPGATLQRRVHRIGGMAHLLSWLQEQTG